MVHLGSHAAGSIYKVYCINAIHNIPRTIATPLSVQECAYRCSNAAQCEDLGVARAKVLRANETNGQIHRKDTIEPKNYQIDTCAVLVQ